MAEEGLMEGAPLGHPFRALRHRFFRRFWLGHCVSLVGTQMQRLAQRWLVYEITGSEALLGLIGALSALPAAVLTPFTGVIADRVEKRLILLGVQSVAATVALLFWLLTILGQISVWHIGALVLVLGLVRSFDVPTRQAFWVELVGKRDLMSAITLHSTSVNLSRLIGPTLAGEVIARLGTAPCFLLNAFSFLPPALALLSMPHMPEKVSSSETFWRSIVEGLRYLVGNPKVLSLLSLVGAWSLFAGQFDVLLPVLSDEVLRVGARGYGILTASFGLGAIGGALGATSLGRFLRGGQLIGMGSVLIVFGLGGLSFVPLFPLASAFLALMGAGMVLQNTMVNTLLQSLVPDRLRGRVMGVYSLMHLGLMPFGSLFYGQLGEWIGALGAFKVGAFSFALLAFGVFLRAEIFRIR